MENIFSCLTITMLALLLTLILTPSLRTLAFRIKLLDKPNARKVHTQSIPLVGGIAVFAATVLALMSSGVFWNAISANKVLMTGAGVLLLVGIVDDKRDISAVLKLAVQFSLAYFAFVEGIRIESLYGIFGIYALPENIQLLLTVVVIAGVINAFNLMDGIDGLAAGLAILGLATFTVLAFWTQNLFLIALFLALIGSLLGFLHFNFSRRNKIFMGDAGSLFLGYIMALSGIMLIQGAQNTGSLAVTLPTVIGVLALPVADSMRVYRRRIKTGYSPFQADKTHIHHLVLNLNVKHKYASVIIVAFSFILIVLCMVLSQIIGITGAILMAIIAFAAIASILALNRDVRIWRERLKKLEDRN